MVGWAGGGWRRGAEWWTATGKINTNVVSYWVLMLTTHGHLRKKYKINGQKEKNEERERCKILTASATPTVTA